MSYISNLKIITELGELNYKQVEDLNLSFSRIVDDFSAIDNRFGDFSYEFNLPITKQNSKVFGAPETLGRKNFFYVNRNISCQVYNNNQLILDGLINLESVNNSDNTYKCKFFSKFKELVDSLNATTDNGEKKTLKSLNFEPIFNWNYETSIYNHIIADYKNSDETIYQYPLSFYSTFYCQNSYYTGHTDYQGNSFDSDRPRENYYYLLNSIGTDNNRMYYHQIPPAIYMVSIVEQILADAGWTLGGQFFNGENVKKILYLYSGEDDIYDKAIAGTEVFSGSTPVDLRLELFLPDMSQSEFLLGVMNMFNLYFKIDVANKIIEFETYDTYFRATDDVDPYDITNKVDRTSSNFGFSYFINNDPSLIFKKAENREVFGDNRVMSGSTLNATAQVWTSTSNKSFNQTFNRVGFIEKNNGINNFLSTVDTIEIPFSEPTIKRHYIWNDYDTFGGAQNAETQNFYLPLLSKQTTSDNNGVKFNKNNADTYLFNNESTIKFQGDGSMMYYYGLPTVNIENKSGKGALRNYLYINMYSGSTKFNVPIPIVSPFQMLTSRDNVDEWLSNVGLTTIDDRRTTTASYLQALYQMLYSSTGFTDSQLTECSLVFDDNGYFHETLWSKYHQYKWTRYQQSELFTSDIQMNSYDWDQLQINRPIRYNKELYSLVSIQGFNPVTQRATISIIKKL